MPLESPFTSMVRLIRTPAGRAGYEGVVREERTGRFATVEACGHAHLDHSDAQQCATRMVRKWEKLLRPGTVTSTDEVVAASVRARGTLDVGINHTYDPSQRAQILMDLTRRGWLPSEGRLFVQFRAIHRRQLEIKWESVEGLPALGFDDTTLLIDTASTAERSGDAVPQARRRRAFVRAVVDRVNQIRSGNSEVP